MSDAQKQESQKTVISFIFGLLIGGLLVWAFMGGHSEAPGKHDEMKKDDVAATSTPTEEKKTETTATTPKDIQVGEGKVTIAEAKAGKLVKVSDVTFPMNEGWIGIRDYNEGKLGWILGVARFGGGLNPTEIELVTPMKSGREYAVVMFKKDADTVFNAATDAQLDTVFTTFKAE